MEPFRLSKHCLISKMESFPIDNGINDTLFLFILKIEFHHILYTLLTDVPMSLVNLIYFLVSIKSSMILTLY